eukprot:scaffold219196_cov34-Prasinocladus_malaysianus.AAC.1
MVPSLKLKDELSKGRSFDGGAKPYDESSELLGLKAYSPDSRQHAEPELGGRGGVITGVIIGKFSAVSYQLTGRSCSYSAIISVVSLASRKMSA